VSGLFVKICGMTRPQDAELAVRLGADALGFVFWPGSPRSVAAAVAKEIVEGLPSGVMTVGVFVDAAVDEVRRTVDAVGLTAVQLHGAETPEYCRRLAQASTVIKAITVGNGALPVDEFDADVIVLVDAHDAKRHGGTGKTANWDAAREIAASRRTILAGGLTANTVKLAVQSVRPYGVDVSSGVESAPGIKDATRLRGFFEALHG
jgi:phosphoribosylanthranilate isomerase